MCTVPSSPAPVPTSPAVHRRDLHGRGLRGPLLPPALPAWRTRAERFDEMVVASARARARRGPQGAAGQCAGAAGPPAAPAPGDRGVGLGRGFQAEPRAGLPARVVLYRRPITSRARGTQELPALVHQVVVEQVALMLGRRPEEIDPDA